MSYFPYSAISMEQIITFINVAKNLNMSKSADELCVAQSTISKRIGLLEEITGVILFTKHKNILRLTPAGKFLKEKLSAEYKNIREAVDHARYIQENSKQTLNIGLGHRFSEDMLIDMIRLYSRKYPEIKVNIIKWAGESIVDKLLDGEIDILMCHTAHVENFTQLEYTTYSRLPSFWITNKKHPAAEKNNFSIEHLLNSPFVCCIPNLEELTLFTNDVALLLGKKVNALRMATNISEAYFDVVLNDKVSISTTNDIWTGSDEIIMYPCDIVHDVCICTHKDAQEKVYDFVNIFNNYLSIPENMRIIDDFMGVSLHNELNQKYNNPG